MPVYCMLLQQTLFIRFIHHFFCCRFRPSTEFSGTWCQRRSRALPWPTTPCQLRLRPPTPASTTSCEPACSTAKRPRPRGGTELRPPATLLPLPPLSPLHLTFMAFTPRLLTWPPPPRRPPRGRRRRRRLLLTASRRRTRGSPTPQEGVEPTSTLERRLRRTTKKPCQVGPTEQCKINANLSYNEVSEKHALSISGHTMNADDNLRVDLVTHCVSPALISYW